MVNPIADAYNFFINVFAALPVPVQHFCLLGFLLMVAATLISLVFRG